MKKFIQATVDIEPWLTCKEKGFNISQICNEALIISASLEDDKEESIVQEELEVRWGTAPSFDISAAACWG